MDPVDWMLGVWLNLMGNWFWAFLLFLAVSAIYIRTRSFGPTFLSLVVGGLVLYPALPGGIFDTLMFFAVVIGITYVAYRVLVG